MGTFIHINLAYPGSKRSGQKRFDIRGIGILQFKYLNLQGLVETGNSFGDERHLLGNVYHKKRTGVFVDHNLADVRLELTQSFENNLRLGIGQLEKTHHALFVELLAISTLVFRGGHDIDNAAFFFVGQILAEHDHIQRVFVAEIVQVNINASGNATGRNYGNSHLDRKNAQKFVNIYSLEIQRNLLVDRILIEQFLDRSSREPALFRCPGSPLGPDYRRRKRKRYRQNCWDN